MASKDFKIGCLECDLEKLKAVCKKKDLIIAKLNKGYQQKINTLNFLVKKRQEKYKKRKEQLVHNHDEIMDLKRTLYKLHPELKNKYNALSAQARIRDNNSCYFCGRNVFEVDPDNTIHHVIPKHLGGVNDPFNLITICGDCHVKLEDLNTKLLKYLKII